MLVNDALADGLVAVAKVLTFALVSHLLGRPSEAGFLAEVRRERQHFSPHLPAQSEVNRRVRWLWAAPEIGHIARQGMAWLCRRRYGERG